MHAVPRPARSAPADRCSDPAGSEGSVEVASSVPSTSTARAPSRLTAEAAWTDPVDDLSLAALGGPAQRGVAFTTTIRPEEDLAGARRRLHQDAPGDGSTVPGPRPGPSPPSTSIGDTKHRPCATASGPRPASASTSTRRPWRPLPSRPARSIGSPGRRRHERRSGPDRGVDVPSSARPAAPIVHSVLPLFRWDDGTEPEQPMAVRRAPPRRRAHLPRAAVVLQRRGRAARRAARAGRRRHRPARTVRFPSHKWGRTRCGSAPGRPAGDVLLESRRPAARSLGLDDRPSDAGAGRGRPPTLPLRRGRRGARM